MNKHIQKGFTLIEMLVVLVIIALVVGISVFGVTGAREQARDARRKADLEQIAAGLELYKADCSVYFNGTWPSPGNSLRGTGPGCPASAASNNYIQSMPDDPSPDRNYNYVSLGCTNVGGLWFCPRFRIWTALETEPTPTLGGNCPGPAVSCGSANCNYCVHNP